MEALKQAIKRITDKLASDSTMSHDKLRKEVDKLFVGEKMDKMVKEHADLMAMMKNMHSMADMKIKNLKHGKDGMIGSRGPAGSPDTSEIIRNKLENLQGEDRLDASAIKGLDEITKDINNLKQRPIGGNGIAGRDLFKDIDISASLDGVTKTFNIAAVWNIISVSLSSYPYGSLRKNIDYEFSPTSITFLDPIDASSQLAAGQKCILTVISA